VLPGKADEQVGEVHLADQPADRRHQDVLNERGNDPAEGHAQDDAHGHVQHVASHGKFFELFQHLALLSS
jgi:hypothetical protein